MYRTRPRLGVAALALLTACGAAGAGQPEQANDELASAAVVTGLVQFNSDGPIRVFDSREYHPGDGSRFHVGASTPIPLAGQTDAPDDIPANATAALVNLTVVVNQPGYGFIAAHGPTWQGNSSINWSTPGTYTNFALVPVTNLSSGARIIQVRVEGNAGIDVIVDLNGWVAA